VVEVEVVEVVHQHQLALELLRVYGRAHHPMDTVFHCLYWKMRKRGVFIIPETQYGALYTAHPLAQVRFLVPLALTSTLLRESQYRVLYLAL
jgi:hypothetical protein